ncbi:hypothetical protein D9M68_652790 [compost metagenome]
MLQLHGELQVGIRRQLAVQFEPVLAGGELALPAPALRLEGGLLQALGGQVDGAVHAPCLQYPGLVLRLQLQACRVATQARQAQVVADQFAEVELRAFDKVEAQLLAIQVAVEPKRGGQVTDLPVVEGGVRAAGVELCRGQLHGPGRGVGQRQRGLQVELGCAAAAQADGQR